MVNVTLHFNIKLSMFTWYKNNLSQIFFKIKLSELMIKVEINNKREYLNKSTMLYRKPHLNNPCVRENAKKL
jgi:hypothetical protein